MAVTVGRDCPGRPGSGLGGHCDGGLRPRPATVAAAQGRSPAAAAASARRHWQRRPSLRPGRRARASSHVSGGAATVNRDWKSPLAATVAVSDAQSQAI